MKRVLIVSSIGIALIIGLLVFSSIYQPKVDVASLITPEPSVEPTPSPTPEIKILEEEVTSDFLFLDFHSLFDIVTTSQYNYIMVSTKEFFNALFQTNVRNYSYNQFRLQYQDIIDMRFAFANDAEIKIPFEKFGEAYIDDKQEYIYILDSSSLEVGDTAYKYTVDIYINSEKSESFYFIVDKSTLEIKIQ